MKITNLLFIATRALSNNKLRALLTMLGIIIGVGSVITMLAIGQGSKASINAQISEMGSNMLTIRPGSDVRGGVRQDASTMQTLKKPDYLALQKHTDLLAAVSPYATSSGQYIYGANNYPAQIYGVSQDYMDIRQLKMASGTIFTDQDIATAAKVCVLGKTLVDNLFGEDEDPIGKLIRFKKIPLRVIGVLEEKGYNTMGQDQDEIVLAPYSTVMKRITAVTHFNQLYASTINETMTDKAITQITNTLRENHGLNVTGAADDFHIRSQQELATMMSSTSSLMTTLLACVAAISLVVGGIGIMNIMYVSVTERTKEIGLRMSVGARGVDILVQFLIEAIIISITGGLIGVILGIGAAMAVKQFAGWPIEVESWTIILSFAVCSFTGVFFGWYPAKKAAKLNPIDALRYE
ncbi:MAG: ABC transporter permease [Rikenellaceae bacterium]